MAFFFVFVFLCGGFGLLVTPCATRLWPPTATRTVGGAACGNEKRQEKEEEKKTGIHAAGSRCKQIQSSRGNSRRRTKGAPIGKSPTVCVVSSVDSGNHLGSDTRAIEGYPLRRVLKTKLLLVCVKGASGVVACCSTDQQTGGVTRQLCGYSL